MAFPIERLHASILSDADYHVRVSNTALRRLARAESNDRPNGSDWRPLVATRITGGILRGRVLRSPAVAGLRPTSERVRAALFSIIGSDAVEGKRVADLYAGTGAVGNGCSQ